MLPNDSAARARRHRLAQEEIEPSRRKMAVTTTRGPSCLVRLIKWRKVLYCWKVPPLG